MTTTNYHNRQPVSSLLPAIREFFPPEILPLLHFYSGGPPTDYQNTKAAIYGGSDQELLEEVRNFANFIGSYDWLELEDHPYNMPPISLKPLEKGGPNLWNYKQDVFPLIVSRLKKCTRFNLDFDPHREIVAEYLRIKEKKLNGTCELVPDAQLELAKLFKVLDLDPLHSTTNPAFQQLNIKLKTTLERKNIRGLIEAYHRQRSKGSKAEDHAGIVAIFRKMNKLKPVHESPEDYEHLLECTMFSLHFIDQFAVNHAEWFLPTVRKQRDRKIPYNIRLFVSGTKSFILARDVWKRLDDIGTVREPIEIFRELAMAEKANDEALGNVEYVKVQLPSGRHRAPFTPYSNGKYFVLTSELLLEMLRYAISVKSLFQKTDWQSFDKFTTFFEDLSDDVFNLTMVAPRLMDEKEAKAIKYRFFKFLDDNFQDLMEDTKPILPVGPEGFTLKDFSREIHRLGISRTFPFSPRLRNHVYYYIYRTRKGKVLRTCDMYAALETFQLIYSLWNIAVKTETDTEIIFGDLYTWICNQGRCSEPPIFCVLCDHEKPEI